MPTILKLQKLHSKNQVMGADDILMSSASGLCPTTFPDKAGFEME